MASLIRKVITVDCDYLIPRFASSYILVDGNEAVIIDNNTNFAVPKILEALKKEGIEKVPYIIITHVHLDHAGGTSSLMTAFPEATLLCHPRASRHVIDPTKLIASAKATYGESRYEELYGTIRPIPEERVRVMEDKEEVLFAGQPLQFLHTRGHANHHTCVYEKKLNVIFTGDTFGLCYPDLQPKNDVFVFPSTSPTDFIPVEALNSISLITQLNPSAVYPTHYGILPFVQKAAAQLKTHLEFSTKLLEEMRKNPAASEIKQKHCEKKLWDYYENYFKQNFGYALSEDAKEIMALDIELNAQGIVYAAEPKKA